MLVMYPAVFSKDENNIYNVIFPDLKSCKTQGTTVEEAMLMAQEVLGLVFGFVNIKDVETPVPSDPLSIQLNKDEFISIICIDTEDYSNKKIIRKHIGISQSLNDKAVQRNINFTSVFVKALQDEIKRIDDRQNQISDF